MKLIKTTGWIIGLFVSIIAVVIIIFLYSGRTLLAEAKQQATIAGIPLSVKDVEKIFSEDQEQNQLATQKIEEALACIITPQGEECKALPLSGSGQGYLLDTQMSPLQARTLTSFIERNDSFFRKMDSISNFNQVRFIKNYGDPDYRKLLQIYIDSRKIINLYCEKMEEAILAGSLKQAVIANRQGVLSQDILLHEPFFIFNYRYTLFINIWVNISFNRLINNFVLPDEELKKSISDLLQCEKNIQKSFMQALYGEVFYFCQTVDKKQPATLGQLEYWFHTYNGNNAKFDNEPSSAMKIWLFLGGDFEKATMISNTIEVKKNLLNFENYFAVKERWEKFNQSQKSRLFAPFCYRYVDLYNIYISNLYSIASIRCATTATAAILYKHKYGKYPESLTKLAPEFIPVSSLHDPYSGELLQVKYGTLSGLPNTNISEHKEIYKTGLTVVASGYKRLNPNLDDIKFIVVDQQKK